MRCPKKECCKQCRQVKFKGTMTKRPVQKQTHRTAKIHAENYDATDIQNKRFFVCVFGFLSPAYEIGRGILKWRCPSVRPSFRPSVRPSVLPSPAFSQ